MKFGRHVDKQINYKILWLKYQIMLKLCTIHLAFDRGCYEAILIENTCKTLGIKAVVSGCEVVVKGHYFGKQLST
jgi:hypothetical protein